MVLGLIKFTGVETPTYVGACDPYSGLCSPLLQSSSPSDEKHGLSKGAKIGIALVVIFFFAIGIPIAIWVARFVKMGKKSYFEMK